MLELDLEWEKFWKVFEKIVKSAISGTWFFDFHEPIALAKGLVLCAIANLELSETLKTLKNRLKPFETLLDHLIPDDRCYGTSWYTKKEEKFRRIKSLGIPKAYEDELSRTKNVLAAPSALLEVKQALEKYRGVHLIWRKDEIDEKTRIYTYRTLLFGGPVSNLYSEWLINESPVRFNLTSPNYDLIDDDGEVFSPDYDFNRKTYLADYGLIIFKEKTSFASKGIVGFMGCHGYGTLASARIITANIAGAKKVARKIISRLESGGDFYIVLEVKVDRGIIEEVDVAKIVKF